MEGKLGELDLDHSMEAEKDFTSLIFLVEYLTSKQKVHSKNHAVDVDTTIRNLAELEGKFS